MIRALLAIMTPLALLSGPAAAADPPAATEADYYKIYTLPIPEDIVLEAGALELMPDRKLAVATRRGEVYMVQGAFSETPEKDVQYQRFAHGLHEVLGLAQRGGWLYVTQRCDVSRLKDEDGDGRADAFEVVAAPWEVSGDYHEYAFGSPFDKDGNIWVVLCLTGSFSSNVPYRGWCFRINEKGDAIATCCGIRSPGGIGINHLGDVFYTDNQGPWNGTCGLKHLEPGSFQGHTAGMRWYETTDAIGPKPEEPKSGSRIMTEAKRIPQLVPTAVLLPYDKMGKSASGIACDTTGGKFGPFENQLFVADQSASTVMRVYLEKINGRYQGVCFPFREGFASGTLPLLMTADGSMFCGGTNRGWGSRGNKPFALERMVWTGQVPFEIHQMRAKPDGFELTFTQAVDEKTAENPASYKLTTYTYIFQSDYGSPEVDHTTPIIERAVVAPDKKSVRLSIKGLREGHVHELHGDGIRSESGQPLLHKQAYYTLNYIPAN